MKTALYVMVLLIGTSGAAVTASYGNPRFNFWLHVPPTLVTLPPPDNGDGQTWQSRDGQVKVLAWGSFGPDVLGIPKNKDYAAYTVKNEVQAGSRVTYRALLAGGFVLSGYLKDGRIFYQKSLVAGGTEATVRTEYPVSQRASWDKLSAEIAGTLKWGTR